MPLTLSIAARSSRGIGPDAGGREDNQDNYLVASGERLRVLGPQGRPEETAARGHGALVAVADGMGGHELGDVAARAAVEALALRWQQDPDAEGPEQTLARWLPPAHDRIRARFQSQGHRNMGTTVTALWLVGREGGWVQVGDSRLYQARGDRVRLLTRDQTHAEFARRDRRPAGPYLAQSFIYGSRGLGQDGRLRLDPGIDTGSIELVPRDRFLLCSDGVSAFLAPTRLDALLCAEADAEATVDALLHAALSAGSDDNLTAVVIDVVDVDPPTPSESESLWSLETTLVPLD